MTARLLIREVGQREFVQHNGEFEDSEGADGLSSGELSIDRALTEGERLCREGNVEAFQVWSLVTTKQRVWALEEVKA